MRGEPELFDDGLLFFIADEAGGDGGDLAGAEGIDTVDGLAAEVLALDGDFVGEGGEGGEGRVGGVGGETGGVGEGVAERCGVAGDAEDALVTIGVVELQLGEEGGIFLTGGAEVAALLEDAAGAVAGDEAVVPHGLLAAVGEDACPLGDDGGGEGGVGDGRDEDALDALLRAAVEGVVGDLRGGDGGK